MFSVTILNILNIFMSFFKKVIIKFIFVETNSISVKKYFDKKNKFPICENLFDHQTNEKNNKKNLCNESLSRRDQKRKLGGELSVRVKYSREKNELEKNFHRVRITS